MIFFSKIIRGMYSYGVNYACYLRWNLMTLLMQLASLIQWNRSRGFRRVFFETLYFSNQKSFSLDLQLNPAISKSKGKWKKVRNSGDFELTEFEIARFDCTWFCPWFFEPSIFGNSGRDFTNKFCFLWKICTRFLEPENSGAKMVFSTLFRTKNVTYPSFKSQRSYNVVWYTIESHFRHNRAEFRG